MLFCSLAPSCLCHFLLCQSLPHWLHTLTHTLQGALQCGTLQSAGSAASCNLMSAPPPSHLCLGPLVGWPLCVALTKVWDLPQVTWGPQSRCYTKYGPFSSGTTWLRVGAMGVGGVSGLPPPSHRHSKIHTWQALSSRPLQRPSCWLFRQDRRFHFFPRPAVPVSPISGSRPC